MHGRCDFAILGATPFAALLALALTERHGRTCCLVGRFPHPLQLSRGMDLSIAALTRPESLRLLKECAADSRQLLAGVGREVLQRTDLVFAATAGADAWTLMHLRQMLHGYGHSTEALAAASGLDAGAFRVGDVQRIVRRKFYEAIPGRLAKAGVVVVLDDAKLGNTSSGGSAIMAGDTRIEVEKTVIADDASALMFAGRWVTGAGLNKVPRTVLLMAAGSRLRSPAIMDISAS